MKHSYRIIYDLQKDAWNWWDAVRENKFMGSDYDWAKNARFIEDDEGRDVARQVAESDRDFIKSLTTDVDLTAINPTNPRQNPRLANANEILLPYLSTRKADQNSRINKYEQFIEKDFSEKYRPACQLLEEITQKPLVSNHFTFWLTTFPRMPYFYAEREIFVFDSTEEFWGMPIDGFMHEALHFQFVHYWGNRPDIKKLSDDEFDYLKEGLTMILDDSLFPILTIPDKGYDNQKAYRAELTSFWQKAHDFDGLVNYGLEILPKFFKP